jgi:hypothetical protein
VPVRPARGESRARWTASAWFDQQGKADAHSPLAPMSQRPPDQLSGERRKPAMTLRRVRGAGEVTSPRGATPRRRAAHPELPRMRPDRPGRAQFLRRGGGKPKPPMSCARLRRPRLGRAASRIVGACPAAPRRLAVTRKHRALSPACSGGAGAARDRPNEQTETPDRETRCGAPSGGQPHTGGRTCLGLAERAPVRLRR